MSDRPPRDVDWIPDDATGIEVPTIPTQNAGWLIEIPPRQFFNWLWNRCSRWFHYLSGQSQEWIVIDSVNTNEKDYDTLAAYLADAPAAGDKVLVKEDQTVTVQTIIPSDITLKFLDGTRLLCSVNIATSVLKFGSNIVIEDVLNIIVSNPGTTAKAVEFDGDNTVGDIFVQNGSGGVLTTAFHVNANKTGNRINGIAKNIGGGTLTNIGIDNSTEDSNIVEIVDEPNNQVWRSDGAKSFRDGLEFDLGSDADGDIYYRDAGVLKRLAKGANDTFLRLVGGVPVWSTTLNSPIINTPSASGQVYSGTYTPSLTNISNVNSSTVRQAFFTRLGNVVTVSGVVAIDPTTAGSRTQFRMTLPIASDLAAFWDLAGSGNSEASVTAIDGAQVTGDPTNDEVLFTFRPTDATNNTLAYTYQYEVL